jgi:hypothetical protein
MTKPKERHAWRGDREAVRRLAPKHTAKEIGEIIHVSENWVHRLARDIGVVCKPPPRADSGTIKLILEDLKLGPSTKYDTAEATGIGLRQAWKLLKRLHKQGRIHIGAWEPKRLAVYVRGRGTDAVWHKLTPEEASRNHYWRKKTGTIPACKDLNKFDGARNAVPHTRPSEGQVQGNPGR